MNKFIVIIFCLLLIINFSGCLNQTDNKEESKDKIIIGINQDVFGFYPRIESFDVVTLLLADNDVENLHN